MILSNLKTVLGEKVGHLLSHSFRLKILEKSSVQVLSKSDDKISGSLKEKCPVFLVFSPFTRRVVIYISSFRTHWLALVVTGVISDKPKLVSALANRNSLLLFFSKQLKAYSFWVRVIHTCFNFKDT